MAYQDTTKLDQQPPPYEGHENPFENSLPDYDSASDISIPSDAATIRFPPQFNSYHQWKFTRTFHLGTSKHDKKFAVSSHAGFFTRTQSLTIYDGLTEKDPVLAKTEYDASMRDRPCTVTIQPRPDSFDDQPTVELLNDVCPYTRTPPTFSIAVRGSGKEAIREQFEWRKSRGNEIKELAGKSCGWKLVRLSRTVGQSSSSRSDRQVGCASDGKEVVAVMAHNMSASMTKGLKFSFLGTGLSGTFGEKWEIMAVLTALKLWSLELVSNTTGTNVAVATGC